MQSYVVVLSLGLCLSRNITYTRLIVVFSSPLILTYHVSCYLQLTLTFLGSPLFFALSYLSGYGYSSPTSFEIMYSKIEGYLYQFSRSCPLHSSIHPCIYSIVYISLSLSDSPLVSNESVTYKFFLSRKFLLTLIRWGEICYHQKMVAYPFLTRWIKIHHVRLILQK